MITSCIKNSQRGSIVIIFVISLVALIAIGGLAVDIGRSKFTQARLQDACDTAALAGALKLRTPLDVGENRRAIIERAAREVFNANLPCDVVVTTPPVFEIFLIEECGTEDSVRCTYTQSVQNMIFGALGQPTSDVEVTAKAGIVEDVAIEVAIALDFSESTNAPAAQKIEQYAGALRRVLDKSIYPVALDKASNPSLTDAERDAIIPDIQINDRGESASTMSLTCSAAPAVKQDSSLRDCQRGQKGDLFYNPDRVVLEYCDGFVWQPIKTRLLYAAAIPYWDNKNSRTGSSPQERGFSLKPFLLPADVGVMVTLTARGCPDQSDFFRLDACESVVTEPSLSSGLPWQP